MIRFLITDLGVPPLTEQSVGGGRGEFDRDGRWHGLGFGHGVVDFQDDAFGTVLTLFLFVLALAENTSIRSTNRYPFYPPCTARRASIKTRGRALDFMANSNPQRKISGI